MYSRRGGNWQPARFEPSMTIPDTKVPTHGATRSSGGLGTTLLGTSSTFTQWGRLRIEPVTRRLRFYTFNGCTMRVPHVEVVVNQQLTASCQRLQMHVLSSIVCQCQ